MSRSKTKAFYIEVLVLVLVILVAMTVIIKVFAGAAEISGEAKRLTEASLVLDNAAAVFEADPESFKGQLDPYYEVVIYNGQGEVDPSGEYEVHYLVTYEDRGEGEIKRAGIEAYYTGDGQEVTRDSLPVAYITTEKYISY